MAIVVFGAGAIGLLIAGRLAQAGQRTILLARPTVAAAIEQQRLRISAEGQVQAVDGLVTITSPTALLPADQPPTLAILCVKGYDTVGALPDLAALQPLYVMTLQNGIGNEEVLAERFGAGRVLSGAITTSVEIEAPGRIAVAKAGGIGIAPVAPGAQAAAIQAATVLRAAGFSVTETGDYRALKWSKALLNMLGNATAAILDMSVAEVYANRQLLAIERRAFREALAVMDCLGIEPLNLPRYPAALLATAMRTIPAPLLNPILRRVVAGGRGRKPPSLQLDLVRGNPRSEGEFLYGAVARAATQAGTSAPTNQALWAILQDIASGVLPWEMFRHQPEQLLTELRRRTAV